MQDRISLHVRLRHCHRKMHSDTQFIGEQPGLTHASGEPQSSGDISTFPARSSTCRLCLLGPPSPSPKPPENGFQPLSCRDSWTPRQPCRRVHRLAMWGLTSFFPQPPRAQEAPLWGPPLSPGSGNCTALNLHRKEAACTLLLSLCGQLRTVGRDCTTAGGALS